MKKCIQCNENKINTEFYTHPNYIDGLMKKCKKCCKINNTINKTGYIYLIKNKSWNNFIKFGVTTNPKKRLQSYQTASPLRDYEMIFISKKIKSVNLIETKIKEKFNTNGYEWINIEERTIDDIIDFIISFF